MHALNMIDARALMLATEDEASTTEYAALFGYDVEEIETETILYTLPEPH